MKTLGVLIIMVLLTIDLAAQPTYEQAMGEALEQFGNAGDLSGLQAAAAQFERIAEAETLEWLPSYYASMIYCILAFRIEDLKEKDKFVARAQTLVTQALVIAPEESEVYTLQGMIYNAALTVDPVNRGQSYSAKANGACQTAIKLNPENPRPYYLQGTTVFYTPEEFGGGKKAAQPLFEQAMELFKKCPSENGLLPSWGKEDCERYLEDCKKEL